jgi:hypothetical protein
MLRCTFIVYLVGSALTRDARAFKNILFQTAMYRYFTVKAVAGSPIFRIVALLGLNVSELWVEEYP